METLRIRRAAKFGLYGIVAFDEAGYEWILKRQFKRDDPLTMKTLEAIRAKKEIDLRYWRKRNARGW